MRNIPDNPLFNIILLFTIIGEFFLPWILEQFYTEYNGKIMVMSALGNPQSPIRLIYNLWLIWLGSFLLFYLQLLALVFFACFVMGDKEQFHNTFLKYEGFWERLSLFCMYIPFIYKAIGNLLF